MKKVIITGANGFIGSSLIKKMVANNVEVVAVDITFAGDRLPATDLITKIEPGVDAALADKIPAGEYDAFYHLAWRGVNGAEKADPTVQLANIQMAVWMQFSNIYGVGNKTGNLVSYTLGELMAGKEATFSPALQPYDFIYVEDLIEAVYRLGANETKKAFYYIGSSSPRILKNYLLRIGELVGYADKVGIGIRPDDGIKYSMDMFCNKDLVEAVGEYVSTDFDNGINKTIAWLKSL